MGTARSETILMLLDWPDEMTPVKICCIVYTKDQASSQKQQIGYSLSSPFNNLFCWFPNSGLTIQHI
jgi:hypothetical protein